jgi:hypothetical protein
MSSTNPIPQNDEHFGKKVILTSEVKYIGDDATPMDPRKLVEFILAKFRSF